jgi:hypothetical protein
MSSDDAEVGVQLVRNFIRFVLSKICLDTKWGSLRVAHRQGNRYLIVNRLELRYITSLGDNPRLYPRLSDPNLAESPSNQQMTLVAFGNYITSFY